VLNQNTTEDRNASMVMDDILIAVFWDAFLGDKWARRICVTYARLYDVGRSASALVSGKAHFRLVYFVFRLPSCTSLLTVRCGSRLLKSRDNVKRDV
jgi:hypothetical protein